MKKYLILVIFAIVQLSANAQKVNIKQFAFLAQDWVMETHKGKIIESWIMLKDSLNGKSYRHSLEGKIVLTETLVIKKINGIFNLCVTGYEQTI